MNQQYTLVGIGEALWDILPTEKQLGGAPANFAYHAHVFGSEAYVVTCVGDDENGHELLSRLRGLGLNCSMIAVDSARPTGTVDVTLDKDGKPTYIIHEDVAWDFIPLTSALIDLASRIDAVSFGTLACRSQCSRDTIFAFLDSTPKNCLRLFDVNLRQSFCNADIIHDLLIFANIFKLNDEELPVIADMLHIQGDERQVMRELLKRYDLRLIALTRGAQGSLLFTEDEISEHQGLKANIVDTVGAGDAFAATVLMGLLSQHPLNKINDSANRIAAFVCSRAGAMPEYDL